MAVFPSIMDAHWSTRNKTSPSPVSNRRGGGFSFFLLYTNQKAKGPLLSKYSREKPSYGLQTTNYPTKGKRGSGVLKMDSTDSCNQDTHAVVDHGYYLTNP